jgi:hypothetical protein
MGSHVAVLTELWRSQSPIHTQSLGTRQPVEAPTRLSSVDRQGPPSLGLCHSPSLRGMTSCNLVDNFCFSSFHSFRLSSLLHIFSVFGCHVLLYLSYLLFIFLYFFFTAIFLHSLLCPLLSSYIFFSFFVRLFLYFCMFYSFLYLLCFHISSFLFLTCCFVLSLLLFLISLFLF